MNALFLAFWGKKYSKDFLNFFLPSLNENLKFLKSKKKKYAIEIWTSKKDTIYIKKNKLFKSISKKINCNFRNIDFVIKEANIKKFSKYELHETICYIFKTSKCFKYEYLWFFYPDQFFSKKFILNISNLTKKKNADLIFMPSLLCKREKISELFKSKKIFKSDFRKIYLSNLDKSNKYVNINYIHKYQFLKVIDIYKKTIIIKSFHTHPLIIKTKNNFEGLRYPFYPSHDEGIASFFARKNMHVIRNLKSGILSSVSQVANSPLVLNNSMKTSIFSGIFQFNETHLKSSEQTFVDGDENSKILKDKIKKVNNKINLLRNGYKTLLKNLRNYPNVKENKYFKTKDYPRLINKIIDFEVKIKKFCNQKLISYNKVIFDKFLKYSQSKIYNKKISFYEFFLKFLNTNNQKDMKHINFLSKIYFK